MEAVWHSWDPPPGLKDVSPSTAGFITGWVFPAANPSQGFPMAKQNHLTHISTPGPGTAASMDWPAPLPNSGQAALAGLIPSEACEGKICPRLLSLVCRCPPSPCVSSLHLLCLCLCLCPNMTLVMSIKVYLTPHPGWGSSVDWVWAFEPNGHRFDSQSEHMPG